MDNKKQTTVTPPIRLIIGNLGGHRAEYLALFSQLLPGAVRMPVPPPLWTLWREHDALFFLTLDDHPIAFLVIAALRSALGRRTVALFLRPGECFRKGRWKYLLKRVLFQIVSKMPETAILTIMPFSVEPRFTKIAAAWIDDPQLWDLSIIEFPQTTDVGSLPKQVLDVAAGRQVVLALGGQNRPKGFDFFSDLWCSSENIRDKFLFCTAGAVALGSETAKEQLHKAGGLVIDRYIENAELLNLYKHASLIWSCYAPDYDQASGIFGRAVQFGIPAIIRSGSFIEKLAAEYDHPFLAIPFDDFEESATRLLGWRHENKAPALILARANASRDRSIKVLQNALLHVKPMLVGGDHK